MKWGRAWRSNWKRRVFPKFHGNFRIFLVIFWARFEDQNCGQSLPQIPQLFHSGNPSRPTRQNPQNSSKNLHPPKKQIKFLAGKPIQNFPIEKMLGKFDPKTLNKKIWIIQDFSSYLNWWEILLIVELFFLAVFENGGLFGIGGVFFEGGFWEFCGLGLPIC